MDKNTENKLKQLFSGSTICGIVIIVIALVMQEIVAQFQSEVLPIFFAVLNILSDLLSIIGTALVIGSIFDFVKNTKDFTELIKKALIEVIQDKTFLNSLNKEEKKKDIFRLIGGNEKYHTDINNYIDRSIERILDIYKKPYRTNTIYNFSARINNSKIEFEGTINYTLHKNQMGSFDPIVSIYENKESKTIAIYAVIRGKKKELAINIKEADKTVKYETIIPQTLQENEVLEIEQHIVMVYETDWVNFYARVVAPAYGFKLYLNCLDDRLEIIDNFIFDDDTEFDIVLDKEKRKITIKSIEWLDEWHGIVILVGRKKNEKFD